VIPNEVLSGYGNVIEQAEAHSFVGLGVMSGWSYKSESGRHITLENGFRRAQYRTYCQKSGFCRSGRRHRIFIEVRTPLLLCGEYLVEKALRMHEQDVFFFRRARFDTDQGFRDRFGLQGSADSAHAGRTFWVPFSRVMFLEFFAVNHARPTDHILIHMKSTWKGWGIKGQRGDMEEEWNIGLLEHWNIGTVECWNPFFPH
jgi:hypothetical protein